jgi:hypothetical protein
MAAVLGFLQNLFGAHRLFADDHLTGAIDLSDASYCLSLLEQNEPAETAPATI